MLRGALRLTRILGGTASLAAGGWVLRALHGAPAALGATPAAIAKVADRSPHWHEGVFVNIEPAPVFKLDREEQRFMLHQLVFGGAASRPAAPVPLETRKAASDTPLAVSWLGHATALIEIDGYRVLTDPVWSNRCSPSDAVGPERLHPPPVQLDVLPAVDAIVISHDHYDHLDIDTVTALARMQRAPFVVPLGVGAHLRSWGIPDRRIIELDWAERAQVGELSLACAPARHFSGRFTNRNLTLWASWAIVGPDHRVYFGGDTGYTTSFRQIGSDYGPFDVTLMPIGAYSRAWPDVHMNPEEAVQAHLDVNAAGGSGGGVLVPIHWCTFRLAPHPWAEPIERLLVAAESAGVQVATPKPGERVLPDATPGIDPWWR